MTESELTQDLMGACRIDLRGAVVLKHSDRANTGYPDLTVTWHQVTSWWEVKFWNEGAYDETELQRITCKRLASQGLCRYVIYEQRKTLRRVIVAHPTEVDRWPLLGTTVPGFNHAWVAHVIRTAHDAIR